MAVKEAKRVGVELADAEEAKRVGVELADASCSTS